MTKWLDINTAPKDGYFLVKVNNGLFSGGWTFHKAMRIDNKFFNVDTKEIIAEPHSWAKVDL